MQPLQKSWLCRRDIKNVPLGRSGFERGDSPKEVIMKAHALGHWLGVCSLSFAESPLVPQNISTMLRSSPVLGINNTSRVSYRTTNIFHIAGQENMDGNTRWVRYNYIHAIWVILLTAGYTASSMPTPPPSPHSQPQGWATRDEILAGILPCRGTSGAHAPSENESAGDDTLAAELDKMADDLAAGGQLYADHKTQEGIHKA